MATLGNGMKLSVKKVERLNEPGRYGDGRGLYLQVSPTGSKSWLFRYERSGSEKMMGLGSALDFTLEEARERAREARRALADGRDPLAEKRAANAANAALAARTITFETAAQTYYELHEGQWKNRKHAAQFLSTLRQYVFPAVGRLSVADISTSDVLRVLEPIWLTKTETASRVRGRMEKVFAWATVRGYRTGDNPARWSGHLKEALPARTRIAPVKHHKALRYVKLPAFMQALREREGVAARALEFLILTAARTSEVTGARWNEIDWDARVWTVPAERMKAGKLHRVPLSDRAIELLQKLPREKGNAYIFAGGRKGTSISNMAMDAVRRRMEREDFTVHGFRSTFRDWAAERTAYPNHVAEMALAHTIGNKVEAAYRRGDLFEKRQRMMGEWADYCASPYGGAASIVPIRSKQ